jgi:hypothetical protein
MSHSVPPVRKHCYRRRMKVVEKATERKNENPPFIPPPGQNFDRPTGIMAGELSLSETVSHTNEKYRISSKMRKKLHPI